MYTINSTSNKTSSIISEVITDLKSLSQNNNFSKQQLASIPEKIEKIISVLDNTAISSSHEFQKLFTAKNKIIELSNSLVENLERGDDLEASNTKAILAVWIDNFLLHNELIQLKFNEIVQKDSLDNHSYKDHNTSDLINQQDDNLDFSDSIQGTISKAAAESFKQKLPSYLAQLPLGICIATGADLVFQFANEKYLEIIDKDISIIGKKVSDTLIDIDSQLIFNAIKNVYDTGEVYIANEVLVKLDRYGQFKNAYFDLVCEPLRELDNSISGVVVICTEVTEIASSRRALEESELKFRQIIDRSPVAKTILRGPEFKVELANKRMLDFFWRRTLEEVQGRPFLELFPELESQVFPQRLLQVYSTGIAHSENNALAYVDSSDGRKEYIFDYEYAPLLDENKKVDGILISAYDVTDRVRSEQALKVSEDRFKSIASVMQQFIWTATPKGQLDYFNEAIYEFSGKTEEDLLTNGWLSIVHPDDRDENIKLWLQSINTGKDFIFEHRFRKSNGDYRWQLSRAVAQRDDQGTILQWVGTSTDIHDQIKFQETLEDLVDARTKDLSILNIELQSSNQDLESFAYISSHDLQEPLRKIQTFISIILDSDYENLSDRGKSYFLRVESAAARMKNLITDLLTYSRTSAVDKDFEKVNLQELLEEIEGDFIETLEDKNGNITVESMPIVSGVSFQLSQLLVNLISNSIKFARDGVPPQIKISSKILSGSEINNPNLYANQKYVEITLQDNGIGFSQEYASKIFEVFQRLHAKGTYDGTGIGLAICKKIVDKHHGLIAASSVPGEGATFTILLPLEL